ncbi:MAG TPA: glycosyltransferase family 39 protein, partial [Candidatus Obscuribacterales bacterium]
MAVHKRDLACFLLVLCAALAWRLTGLTFDSLWLDEGYQSVVDAYGQALPDFSQVPDRPFVYRPQMPAVPQDMLSNFRKVDQLTPPLYQLLLNRWITAFGSSDIALRLLTVLISVCSVGAVFICGRLLFGLPCAFLAGMVQAFSPFDVYYGQEVRMYALEELAATVSCASLLLFLFRPLSRSQRIFAIVLHGIAVWALINSHYTGLFVLAFEIALGLLVACGRRSPATALSLLAGWLLALTLWLPWLRMFLQAAAMRTASFYVARQPSFWWPFAALFLRIPANWLVFLSGKQVVGPALPLFASSAVILFWPIVCPIVRWLKERAAARRYGAAARRYGAAVPGNSMFASDGRRTASPLQSPRRERIVLACVWGWAIVPAVLLWAIDVVENHRVIEISRYTIATAPAIYLLAGFGLAALTRRPKFLVPLLTCQLIFA